MSDKNTNTAQLLGEAFMKLHNVKNNHFCDSATVEDAVEFIKQRGTKVPDWMHQTSAQMSPKGTFLSNTEMVFISPETSGFEFPICCRWTSLEPGGVSVTGKKEKMVDGNKVVTQWQRFEYLKEALDLEKFNPNNPSNNHSPKTKEVLATWDLNALKDQSSNGTVWMGVGHFVGGNSFSGNAVSI